MNKVSNISKKVLNCTKNNNGHIIRKKYEQTSHKFIPRYNGPDVSQMTSTQTEIYKSIIKSRPRTGISGPFQVWLSCPKIASHAQQLGQACRYGTSLSFRESELVILLTGAKHASHAEFDIHVGEAVKAGIDMSLIEAIPRDGNFSKDAVEDDLIPLLLLQHYDEKGGGYVDAGVDNNDSTQREVSIVRFVAELLETSTISDQMYKQTKIALGNDDVVLVEITSIVGYYTYCAYTLNVFRIPTPPNPDS